MERGVASVRLASQRSGTRFRAASRSVGSARSRHVADWYPYSKLYSSNEPSPVDALAELDAGRASTARPSSSVVDALDDMECMVAGVKRYERKLCMMLARIDRAKAALTQEAAAAVSIIDLVDPADR